MIKLFALLAACALLLVLHSKLGALVFFATLIGVFVAIVFQSTNNGTGPTI